MVFPSIYAVRGVAGVSLISALSMVIICGLVFATRVEDLSSSKFPSSNVPPNISDSSAHTTPQEQEAYKTILEQLNKLWIYNRPLLASSSLVAMLGGLLQIIFSCLLLFSDSKAFQLYIRKWITVHFILVCISFIIILNTVILSEDHVEKQSWEYLTSSLRKFLEVERPFNDYTKLFKTLGTGPQLIYISVGTNLGIILVLMSVMLILMRNQPGIMNPVISVNVNHTEVYCLLHSSKNFSISKLPIPKLEL